LFEERSLAISPGQSKTIFNFYRKSSTTQSRRTQEQGRLFETAVVHHPRTRANAKAICDVVFFTVVSTVWEVFAAKRRNSAQRTAKAE
jgi:hypothetical protein